MKICRGCEFDEGANALRKQNHVPTIEFEADIEITCSNCRTSNIIKAGTIWICGEPEFVDGIKYHKYLLPIGKPDLVCPGCQMKYRKFVTQCKNG